VAGGVTTDELLEDYPEIEKKGIQAALLYASQLVDKERVFAVK